MLAAQGATRFTCSRRWYLYVLLFAHTSLPITPHPVMLRPSVGECQWLHLDLIREMQDFCHTIYNVVDYAYTTIPTYPRCAIRDRPKYTKKLRQAYCRSIMT